MTKTLNIMAALTLAACLSQAGAALAAPEINPTQTLGFGKFLLLNNNAAHTVSVTPLGVTNYPPALVSQIPAREGIYELQGFLPDTDLSITISPPSLSLSCACATPVFTVDNFEISPVTPRTNPAGNVTLRLGARLHTDGTRALYREGSYSGQISIIVNN